MGSDTVAFWHNHAARTPMLKPAQEITLGKTIQAWLSAEDPSPQLIRRGKKAKERMITSNLKLVVSICQKYSKRVNRTANLEEATKNNLEDLGFVFKEKRGSHGGRQQPREGSP